MSIDRTVIKIGPPDNIYQFAQVIACAAMVFWINSMSNAIEIVRGATFLTLSQHYPNIQKVNPQHFSNYPFRIPKGCSADIQFISKIII